MQIIINHIFSIVKFFPYIYFCCFISFILLSSGCGDEPRPTVHGVFEDDSTVTDIVYDLDDIQNGGELIVLTLYGPDTYFEFRGEEFGNQFRMAQAFAKTIGVNARVNICKTQKEIIQKLISGEGDLVAYDMPVDSLNHNLIFCGKDRLGLFLDSLAIVEHDNSIKTEGQVGWVVRSTSPDLAKRLDGWINSNDNKKLLALSQPRIPKVNDKRHYTAYTSDDYFPDIPYFDDYPVNNYKSSSSYSSSYTGYTGTPSYNGGDYSKGTISRYDDLFKRYAPTCGLDWRLLAAMAYNESSFNPNAVSYMGAMGLMQLMPSTARQYGVNNPFDPEQSVKGAAKLMSNLLAYYSSVPNPDERINFALAAYNAGQGHVDDARRLAKKRGKDHNVWKNNVDEFVLYMSNPEFFNDPVVKFGYFRGGETYNYVNYIRSDWDRYRSR